MCLNTYAASVSDMLLQSLSIAVVQCLTAHVEDLTSTHVAEISPDCAQYVQATLLQGLKETAASDSPDPSEQQKAQVHRVACSEVTCSTKQGVVECETLSAERKTVHLRSIAFACFAQTSLLGGVPE